MRSEAKSHADTRESGYSIAAVVDESDSGRGRKKRGGANGWDPPVDERREERCGLGQVGRVRGGEGGLWKDLAQWPFSISFPFPLDSEATNDQQTIIPSRRAPTSGASIKEPSNPCGY